MRTIKGCRQIELQMPISLHDQIKELANGSNPPFTQGRTTLLLLMIGIKKFEEQKSAAGSASKEPADLESGGGGG